MKRIKPAGLASVIYVWLIVYLLTLSGPMALGENAALSYYQAFLTYRPENDMQEMLVKVATGQDKPTRAIELHAENNRYVINCVTGASNVLECDWGSDYSGAPGLKMLGLAAARNVAYLMVCDARIMLLQGKHRPALERCVAVKRMARHVSGRPFITYVVGMAVDALADNCFVEILTDMPKDSETLAWLKNQLDQTASMPFTLAGCIDYRSAALIKRPTDESIAAAMASAKSDYGPELAKAMADHINQADKLFFEKNIAYVKDYMARAKAALDLSYPQAYAELERLGLRPRQDALGNADATLAVLFAPSVARYYSQSVQARTYSNAIRAAVAVYIVCAKTDELPQTLPYGLPKDLFSGEDFAYEVTSNGFVLRCRGKDLYEGKTHQYEFRLTH